MYSSTYLLAFIAAGCSGAPTSKSGPPQFTIHQELVAKKPANLTPAGTLLQTYWKYANAGAVPPPKLLDGQQQQTGSVVASPVGSDAQYVCPVTVGGQTVNLDFDTGSSDLWVFSTVTPANESAGHNIYNPDMSPTSALLKNETWNIGYADGSGASGIVYADTVVVGGATATFQAVEAATSVASSFASNTASDGLLGLSFSKLNTIKPVQQQTFFDNVKPTLNRKLFAVDLRHQQPGSYDFGYLDGSKYDDPITYIPVNSTQGYWLFIAGGYGVGESKRVSGNQGLAVADTGTSIIFTTSQAVYTYYAQVPNVYDFLGTLTFPCDSDLPDFHTSIGGRTFTVPGSYINYAVIGQITEGGPDYCIGGLQVNSGLPFSIYGDTFLKSVYAVYDETQDTPRLGFATKQLDV